MCATTIGLAGPAGASTNIASAARDDAADSRADITEVIDTYSDGVAGVGVRVVSPEDPRTAYNWVNGFTFFVWTVSTPAGAFDVVYHHFGSELSAEVTKDSGATTVCNATPDFDGTTYTAVFAASCIGHPSSFQVRAFANYDDALAGGGGGLDFAPSLTEFCCTVTETITNPGTAPTTNPGGGTAGDTPPSATASGGGYWMADANGTVYNFGDAKHYGNEVASTVKRVDIEPTPSGNGYWILAESGAVHNKGDAKWVGSALNSLQPGEKAAALSSTPSGNGYWIFTDRGRVLAFGDAPFKGDMAGVRLNGSVLDSVATPSGQGYWMIAADGGIFAFDAPFYGSMGSTRLNKPISGIVPGKAGYLMVAEDGGIFAFGDVKFHGSLGSNPPASPVVAVALLP